MQNANNGSDPRSQPRSGKSATNFKGPKNGSKAKANVTSDFKARMSDALGNLTQPLGFPVVTPPLIGTTLSANTPNLLTSSSDYSPLRAFPVAYNGTTEEWEWVTDPYGLWSTSLRLEANDSIARFNQFVAQLLQAGIGSRDVIAPARLMAYWQDVSDLYNELCILASLKMICDMNWSAMFGEEEPVLLGILRSRLKLGVADFDVTYSHVFASAARHTLPVAIQQMIARFRSPFLLRPDAKSIALNLINSAIITTTTGEDYALSLLELSGALASEWAGTMNVSYNFFAMQPLLPITAFLGYAGGLVEGWMNAKADSYLYAPEDPVRSVGLSSRMNRTPLVGGIEFLAWPSDPRPFLYRYFSPLPGTAYPGTGAQNWPTMAPHWALGNRVPMVNDFMYRPVKWYLSTSGDFYECYDIVPVRYGLFAAHIGTYTTGTASVQSAALDNATVLNIVSTFNRGGWLNPLREIMDVRTDVPSFPAVLTYTPASETVSTGITSNMMDEYLEAGSQVKVLSFDPVMLNRNYCVAILRSVAASIDLTRLHALANQAGVRPSRYGV